MAKRDYYEVLGVSKSASEAEIKKGYRRMAMKFHPDRNPDDKEAEKNFKEVQEAWDILSNADKKAAYDHYGHAGVDGSAGRGGGGAGGGGFGDIFGDVFGDIFGGAGGGGGRQQQAYRGADLRYELALDLEDAVFGTETKLKLPVNASCETCDGSGAAAGSKAETCNQCGGAGAVRVQQGFFSMQQTCPKCRGNGTIITNPCGSCHGAGKVRKNKTLSVKVPAGVDTGDRIRLSGEGEAGERGGPPGDLYVEVIVNEHPIFKRDGANLYSEIPISFTTAALGGELKVPTLDGKVTLKIPPETQSGKSFRLRGKGVKPVRGGVAGDLLVKTAVEVPVNLTKEQKELLGELERSLSEGGKRHSPKASGWLDSMKSFFDRF